MKIVKIVKVVIKIKTKWISFSKSKSVKMWKRENQKNAGSRKVKTQTTD